MQTQVFRSAALADLAQAMKTFTDARTDGVADELWLAEHQRVFSLGLASKPEHLLAPGDIPCMQTNRGGQVTYHGPGQVTAYPLVNLKRLQIYVKEYVFRLEQATVQTLAHFGITGLRIKGAPGVYVALPGGVGEFAGLAKIAALGVKVSRHYAYHGVALNVAMDLEPFSRINPCGYQALRTVDFGTLGVNTSWEEAAAVLAERLSAHLSP
jgi:lipoyl(octanoyl) transferase